MSKYDKVIPVVFFLIFVLLTVQGISWGAPGFWHPDEVIQQADKAIERGYRFDEKDFYYPSLPKYVMYGVGKLVYAMGLDKTKFIEAARLVSVFLGGLVVALVYVLTRQAGGGVLAGTLAALFVLSHRDTAIYSRFAHGDIYLAFFACLTSLWLLKYRVKGHRLWLYIAFFSAGLAISSKYNGMGLFLAALFIFLVTNRRGLFENPFTFFEMLFVSTLLSAFGFAIGTPRSILSMEFYFQNAVPAIRRLAIYEIEPDTVVGIFGQWAVLRVSLGTAVSLVFLVALIWHVLKVIRYYAGRHLINDLRMELIAIVLLCLFALDLPVLISYRYPPRYLLSTIPILAVLAGSFVEEALHRIERGQIRYLRELSIVGLAIVIAYSFLRVVAVLLLFLNDNRILASRFLGTLPEGSTLEYTYSPPNIPKGHFSKLYEHPSFDKLYADQPAPGGNSAKYNQGEAGVERRQPDYLLVDSFTYGDFLNQSDCVYRQMECEFYSRLFLGETNYKLIKKFDYQLPPFLPVTRATFVNPVIQIYQRESSP